MRPATQSHFIDLLRHGEPRGGDRFRGTRDDPLSATGWQQMRAAVADASPWDVIVTSPLRRCAEYASELAQRHDLPLETEPGLRELAFGVWEGRAYSELRESDPEALQAFFHDPVNNTPPGGESLAACRERVHTAWDAIIGRHDGRHLLLVCHGAVMRIIYSRLLKMPDDAMFHIEVPYACLTRVRRHPDGDRLVFHGGCP